MNSEIQKLKSAIPAAFSLSGTGEESPDPVTTADGGVKQVVFGTAEVIYIVIIALYGQVVFGTAEVKRLAFLELENEKEKERHRQLTCLKYDWDEAVEATMHQLLPYMESIPKIEHVPTGTRLWRPRCINYYHIWTVFLK